MSFLLWVTDTQRGWLEQLKTQQLGQLCKKEMRKYSSLCPVQCGTSLPVFPCHSQWLFVQNETSPKGRAAPSHPPAQPGAWWGRGSVRVFKSSRLPGADYLPHSGYFLHGFWTSSWRLVENSEKQSNVSFHVVRCMDAISGIIPEKWLVRIC